MQIQTNANKGAVVTSAWIVLAALLVFFFIFAFFYFNRPWLDGIIAGINSLLQFKLP